MEAAQRLDCGRSGKRSRRDARVSRGGKVLRLGGAFHRSVPAALVGALVTANRSGSLVAGLRSLGQGRLVLLLAATSIALALPAAFVLQPSLQQVFAETLAGDHILRNHPDFAPVDVLEL